MKVYVVYYFYENPVIEEGVECEIIRGYDDFEDAHRKIKEYKYREFYFVEGVELNE